METLGGMTYGLYVLTTCYEETINGMIASWVSQVSYDPPLVMVAVHPKRYSHQLIENSGVFALHLLSQDQKDLLKRFKGSDPAQKFATLQWSLSKTGCPILENCLGYLECQVFAKYAPGNHTLFIGRVMEAKTLSAGKTLSTFDYGGVYTGKI